VNQPALVGVAQGEGGAAHDFAGFRDRQPTQPTDERAAVEAVHEFHQDEPAALALAGIVGPHDPRVIETTHGDHLLPEQLDGLPRVRQQAIEELERHHSPHPAVFGAIHGPEPAARQPPLDAQFREKVRHLGQLGLLVAGADGQ
jgi:hypothetical protein